MFDNKEKHILRSVIFLSGQADSLLSKGDPYGQLDGARELMLFCDSYVLNERTVVSGISSFCDGALSERILSLSGRDDGVETAGYGASRYDFDISVFEDVLNITAFSGVIKDIDEEIENKERGVEIGGAKDLRHQRDILVHDNRVRQQQALILLADQIEANYIAERRYGSEALKRYPEVVRFLPHMVVNDFKECIRSEMEKIFPGSLHEIYAPSFLAEALRNSDNVSGVFKSLLEMRYSQGAKHYRSLIKLYSDPKLSLPERYEALKEASSDSNSLLAGEGLKSRFPTWIKWTIGLTAAVTSLWSPHVALVPIAIEGGENLDKYLRRRSNIYGQLSRISGIDLYPEIKRIFPGVSFGPEHLNYFLKNENFGWKDKDSIHKYFLGR